MLRRAWDVENRQYALSVKLGLPRWGTPRQYLSQNMVRGFIEECNHEYESLLGKGDPEEKGLIDENHTLVTAFTSDI